MWKATFNDKIEWQKEPVTGMDAAHALVQTRSNFRTARRYTVAYNDGDDDVLMGLLHPQCNFGTLWGVVDGPVATTVALAQERELGLRFTGQATNARSSAGAVAALTGGQGGDPARTQAFTQVTDNLFERNGWCRRADQGSWWRWLTANATYTHVRESLVVEDGVVTARVLQYLPSDGVVMFLGQSNTGN